MLGRTYDRLNCSAARALEIVGERWSLMILRNAMFVGTTRFNEFQRQLGIAPNILSARLEGFVEAGLMRVRELGDGDPREYLLTQKGVEFEPVIIALTTWGDRWAAPDGPPVLFEHIDCGGRVHQELACAECDVTPVSGRVKATPGPGMTGAPHSSR